MTLRGVLLWIDRDFDSIRPWTIGILFLGSFVILASAKMLGVSENVLSLMTVAILGVVLVPVTIYYLLRSTKNFWRVMGGSIRTLSGDRDDNG
ncbi:hypothetical protein SPAN111604_01130 [Sphingomonas antarctica]